MNAKTRVMVIGGLIGGVVGVLAAQLYLRSVEGETDEEGEVELPAFEPGDLIKLTLSVLGTLKLIDSLQKPGKKRG
jgi:hypothetical protein